MLGSDAMIMAALGRFSKISLSVPRDFSPDGVAHRNADDQGFGFRV